MSNFQNPLAKKEKIVIQELPDELLIYNLANDKAFCLNKTSAFVWKACDGTKDAQEISRLMSKSFNSTVNEDVVWLALDQLAKDDLLEVQPDNKFAGMSRREVIRRVGFASVIALPIVSSLIAPTAVSAVACTGTVTSCGNCNNGTPCSSCSPACGMGTTCQCQNGACVCV